MLEALPTDAFAQSPVCHAIRRGESATQAARRMTGNGQNAYQRVVPDHERLVEVRSQVAIRPYSCRLAGLRHQPAIRACLRTRITSKSRSRRRIRSSQRLRCSRSTRGADARPRAPTPAMDRSSPSPTSFEGSGVSISRCCGLCAAMVVPWLGWRIVDDYLARRKTASIIVRYFVHRFVDEFERPLVRYDVGERPVRSRLRCGARLRRFDILLAPGEGRRYPNLSDHKKNVEYDVARVDARARRRLLRERCALHASGMDRGAVSIHG